MITVRFVARVEYVAEVADDDAALAVWQMRSVARDAGRLMDDLERRGYTRIRRVIESGHTYAQSPVRARKSPTSDSAGGVVVRNGRWEWSA